MSDRAQEQLRALAEDASVLQIDEHVAAAKCFYCECTESDACVLWVDDPSNVMELRTCGWHREPDHRGFAVCSNPECVKEYLADPGAP